MNFSSDDGDFQDATTSHEPTHGRNESVEKYMQKLEELDKLHFQKKIEKRVLQNCINNVQVAEFLHNHVFFPSYDDDDNELSQECISEEERKYIRHVLEKKEEMNKAAALISKENRDLEKVIINKRLHLRDCMKKRKTLWNKAAKIYESTSEKVPEFEKSVYDMSSGILSRISSIDLENEDSESDEYKMVKQQIVEKTARVHELACILHKLISFSGVKWSDNKNLLEVLFCTGNILESEFNVKNLKELKKIVDDVIHKLNLIKI